jgi:hypothetical protein
MLECASQAAPRAGPIGADRRRTAESPRWTEGGLCYTSLRPGGCRGREEACS